MHTLIYVFFNQNLTVFLTLVSHISFVFFISEKKLLTYLNNIQGCAN